MGTGRVRSAWKRVLAQAKRRLPWLSRAKLRFCLEADRLHRKKWRFFAHANHHNLSVCIARAAEQELTDAELVGMLAHEMGHVVGDTLGFPEHKKATRSKGTPWRVQLEADWIARRVLGFKILYNRRTLQEVTPRRRVPSYQR